MNKINPFPVTSSVDDIKDVNKVIQKQHFKNNINDDTLKTIDSSITKKSNDKIECMICGKKYTRCNKSKHNKTKHHVFCLGLNKKWRETIIN